MSMSSRKSSLGGQHDDWVLVIGTLPINGHQNAWRAVKDLLKRLLTALGVATKEHAKVQQVHIVDISPNGRYGVCRFGSSQQAATAFDWIGGNVWHGARIGAWLYRVGSELNSSAVLVDSWDRHCDAMKNTPLEAFWGIGNAFLQRTPTAGPVSPIVRPPSPSYLPPPATISPISPVMSEMAPWDNRRHEQMSWGNQHFLADRQRKQPIYFKSSRRDHRGVNPPYRPNFVQERNPVVICNGSDEAVPIFSHGREVLVG